MNERECTLESWLLQQPAAFVLSCEYNEQQVRVRYVCGE